MTETEKCYLGDGVYAEFDGYHVVLMTGSPFNPDNKIYLDSHVLVALDKFVERLNEGMEEEDGS